MLEFYLAEHTQAFATAIGPLLIAACGLQPRAVMCPICRLPSQLQPCRRGKASKIHICYLLCKISNNSLFHCSVYM